MTTEIPALQTLRLLLRPQVIADWPRYQQLMASDRAKYMGGPYDKAAAWGLFCHDLAQWPLLGHGALMFECLETGECLGQVGINHGPLFPERELGWFVYPQAEAKGYAFEAAQAFKSWAFETQKFTSLVSYIDADNLRSISLAKRLGGELDSKAARPDPSDLVYRYSVDK